MRQFQSLASLSVVFGAAPTKADCRLNTSAAGTEPNAIVERRVTDVEMYFSREMEHAREMAQGDQREFWQGYCRGLLRGFLGPCAVHDEWHSRMLEHGALDESARGYVEAFRAIEQVRGAGSDPDDDKRGQE